MLHKDYYHNGSAGRQSEGVWTQDELIGGKLSVVK
jgi:hypothetical protein